jgi:hypothetical protein
MNNENTRNIEFVHSEIISKLTQISNEYTVPFDTLVNFAVLQFIDDVNLLRLLRSGQLSLAYLNERVLF